MNFNLCFFDFEKAEYCFIGKKGNQLLMCGGCKTKFFGLSIEERTKVLGKRLIALGEVNIG